MNIKVIIAMHKPYQLPKDDLYLPLHVGAVDKPSIIIDEQELQRDDTGENISKLNPYYCELTGLYWAWKNLSCDAIGLAHYRRHFSNKSRSFRRTHTTFESVLTMDEAQNMMSACDIILPNKRRYYIETLYSHYCHTLDGNHLDKARAIISEYYPEYLPYVDRAYKQTYGYMFNMAIFKKVYLNEYCQFIFDVLDKLSEKIDVESLDAFNARLFGRVSEILFNAYILKKQAEGVKCLSCRTIDMEPVNWMKKIGGFLAAKFFGKKYTKSM